MSVNTKSSGSLMQNLNAFLNSLQRVENKVNYDDVEEMKQLLKRYDVVLNSSINETDSINKYQEFYFGLFEFAENKKKEIKDFEEKGAILLSYENHGYYHSIVKKMKENTNQIIDCINRIVERIRDLKITQYFNAIEQLDRMKVDRYQNEDHTIKKELQRIEFDDAEMNIINNSMGMLKQWSCKNTFKIIFDSKVDGDGDNYVLHDRVMNRRNLYFIISDNKGNIYGGYVGNKIHKSGSYSSHHDKSFIRDKNAFVFSLIRNGEDKNTQYFMRQNEDRAFILNNDSDSRLFTFGIDVHVYPIGIEKSRNFCNNNCYFNFNTEDKALTDLLSPKYFEVHRIIVIQMN
ncbi:TLDc domain-containing protein [Entamoeba marina]